MVAKVGYFMVLEIKHLRRMLKMKRGNSNIKSVLRNQELNPDGYQQANGGKSSSHAAPCIELLEALEAVSALSDVVVHSLGCLSYKRKHDPSVLPDFLSSPHCGLSRENSSACIVCCDGGFFKIYVKSSSFSLQGFFRSWGK